MDHKRAAAACFVLGFAFLVLGSATAQGMVSRTVRACTTVGDPRFLGLGWDHLTLEWDDGCTRWAVSIFGAVGVLFVTAAAGFGGVAALGRIRG